MFAAVLGYTAEYHGPLSFPYDPSTGAPTPREILSKSCGKWSPDPPVAYQTYNSASTTWPASIRGNTPAATIGQPPLGLESVDFAGWLVLTRDPLYDPRYFQTRRLPSSTFNINFIVLRKLGSLLFWIRKKLDSWGTFSACGGEI